jgi:hypothetical protein
MPTAPLFCGKSHMQAVPHDEVPQASENSSSSDMDPQISNIPDLVTAESFLPAYLFPNFFHFHTVTILLAFVLRIHSFLYVSTRCLTF